MSSQTNRSKVHVHENCLEIDSNDTMASKVALQRKYEYVMKQWKDEEDETTKEM